MREIGYDGVDAYTPGEDGPEFLESLHDTVLATIVVQPVSRLKPHKNPDQREVRLRASRTWRPLRRAFFVLQGVGISLMPLQWEVSQYPPSMRFKCVGDFRKVW